MLYRVNVKPSLEIANVVSLPSFDMVVETSMSPSNLKDILSLVCYEYDEPLRYITINNVGKKARKHITDKYTIGQAVDKIATTKFNVEILEHVYEDVVIGNLSLPKQWHAWHGHNEFSRFSFIRYVADSKMSEYENKILRCAGTAMIADFLYMPYGIKLSSGKDCLFFEDGDIQIKGTKDGIQLIKEQVITTTKTITV